LESPHARSTPRNFMLTMIAPRDICKVRAPVRPRRPLRLEPTWEEH
jgi:hypothetical protein